MEKNTIPQSEAIALYNVYRDYVKHEDTLMNVRMTWFLTTQAFLFSCYALLNQKRLSAGTFELVRSWQEFIGDPTDLKFKFGTIILTLICFFGFFTARRSYISGCGTRPEWGVCESAEYHRRGRCKGQGRGVGFSRIPAESRHGDMGLDRDYALLFAPRLSKLRRSGQRASRAPLASQFVIPAKRSASRDRIKAGAPICYDPG
ncbi:MAG: hypothetical protein WBS14_01525 [Rhodomicrobium sp.]